MKAQIDSWINRAEDLWIKELSEHASNLFAESFLPSHDHTHHRRVWNNCRILLKEIATFNPLMDQSLVEGLLISTYFHDLGMARSTREDHGYLGKEICESYFQKSSGNFPIRFDEVLEAIERHDVKKAGVSSVIRSEQSPSILDILSIADDLEALGIIGITDTLKSISCAIQTSGTWDCGSLGMPATDLKICCKIVLIAPS